MPACPSHSPTLQERRLVLAEAVRHLLEEFIGIEDAIETVIRR